MSLTTRPATPADAQEMCVILNQIIAARAGTAHRAPFSVERMIGHYIDPTGLISCIIAEDDQRIVGFQKLGWPETAPDYDVFAKGWAIIATFARIGYTGRGVGRTLFKATRSAARGAGVASIDASISTNNTSGLGYYSAMGFVDYGRRNGLEYSDGGSFDQICMRFDLSEDDRPPAPPNLVAAVQTSQT